MSNEIKLVITLVTAEDDPAKSRINLQTPDELDGLQIIGLIALAMQAAQEVVSGGRAQYEINS